MLIRQFRFPTWVNGNADGLLIETPAGLLDNASPGQCIRGEVEEETGYRSGPVCQVFEAYMSPGSVTEKLFSSSPKSLGRANFIRWRERFRGRGHRGSGAALRQCSGASCQWRDSRCENDPAAPVRGSAPVSRVAAAAGYSGRSLRLTRISRRATLRSNLTCVNRHREALEQIRV